MNNINPTKEQKLEILNQILNDLKQKGNLKGVIFSYREGGTIAENLSENYSEFNSDEYSSMCASVLESALGLGKTIGGKKFNKIIAELDKDTIILIECDEKTFLSFILNDISKINPILDEIEIYIRKLVFLY
jgi:predicted regulator of Ras-like GTPase activity (Roadblock/LC7/MglB family)